MGRIYYDKDADLKSVSEQTIAIIGYGNQGRAQALNMRDSGVKRIIVGSVKDRSYKQAEQDGFEVMPIESAAKAADIVFMLIPDEVAPPIYKEQIEPNLEAGNTVNFSSGYNIFFKHIIPRHDLDIVLVAPRMIGDGVRELYKSGEGFPSFVCVEQDASGKAKEKALGLAKAIGSTKQGAIEATFADETILDLMTEQGIWPIIYNVFTCAYELYKQKGHPVEASLMELYMSKEPAVMMERAADMGFFKQLPLHSRTSQYGQLTGYNKVNLEPIKSFLTQQYERIKSGDFAKEWAEEQEQGCANLEKLKNESFTCEMSKEEEELHEKLSKQ